MQNPFMKYVSKVMTNFQVNNDQVKQWKPNIVDMNYFEAVSTSKLIGSPDPTRIVSNDAIKNEMSAFFTETSFTALTQIYKANSVWKRLLWTFLVIGMFAWLTVQCYWLLARYYSYPVEVKMDLKASNTLEFPSVTICNLNPIKQSNVFQEPYTPLMKFVKPEMKDILFTETLNSWTFNGDCRPGVLVCKNGRCLHEEEVCDGVVDCPDGADENNCTDHKCSSYQWKCTSLPKCIPINLRCDRTPGDCTNTSLEDEVNCENNTCPGGFFRCSSGLCLIQEYVCDGIPDCDEDEIHCSDSASSAYISSDPQGKNNTSINETTTQATSSHRSVDTTTKLETTAHYRRKRQAHFRHLAEKTEEKKRHSKNKGQQYNDVDLSQLFQTDDGGDNIIQVLRLLWDDTQGSMTKDEFIQTLHSSYLAFQKSEILNRKQIKQSGNKPIEDRSEAHHRIKRRGRQPPQYPRQNSLMEVDWNALLQNSSFNKWNMLTDSSMASRFYNEKDEEYDAAMTYAYITAKLPMQVVEKSGHQKENFIASCDYEGYQCSPVNFTYSHSHKYGNCYTFNSKFANSEKLETRFPGPARGLQIELFIDQKNYVANLATEAGARVLIHKKGSVPFPEDEGISVMPGRSTSIGIRQVTYSRLPPPHGVCGNTCTNKDYYAANFGTDYSKLACLKSCYQDLSMYFCNCSVPFYFVLDVTRICDLNDKNTERCVTNLHTNYTKSIDNCDKMCPQPCHETRYELAISTAKWPSDSYTPYLQEQLGQTNYMYRNIENSDHEFTKLQIYYQDLIYTHVEQQKGYESMNLISDLGGQLGLWLGLSAITIGELCSCLFAVGRLLPLKCWANKTKPTQDNLTSIRSVEPSTIEMYNDLCPTAAKYIPPDLMSTNSMPV